MLVFRTSTPHKSFGRAQYCGGRLSGFWPNYPIFPNFIGGRLSGFAAQVRLLEVSDVCNIPGGV